MPALLSLDAARLPHPARLWSLDCRWAELCTRLDPMPGRDGLRQGTGWVRRWTVRWRFGGTPLVCTMADLSTVPIAGSAPVRRFSWRTGQKNRPGLQFLTGRSEYRGRTSLGERTSKIPRRPAGDVTRSFVISSG